jgi:N-acetylmuramic acid 6-phosphate (MurNAc-6-P) etherase
MVDVKTSNHKLEVRARGILRSILESLPEEYDIALVSSGAMSLGDDEAVSKLIAECGGVKLAAITARWGCTVDEARDRLDGCQGVLRQALSR